MAAELRTTVWVDQLQKNFYPDSSFLNYVKDFSSLVDNDKIMMAEVGLDPVVLINNTTYPIESKQRIDTPYEIELDKFETENTLIRRPEVLEYSYDQLETVLYGHRMSLRSKTAIKAAHAIAPTADTPFTPVIEATGDVNDLGFKRLTFEDVLKLKRRYDDVDIPNDKRVLVLCPKHVEDLMLQDRKAFKDLLEMVNGQPNRITGFSVLEFTKTAFYNTANNQKKGFASAILPTDAYSSFAFHGDEVMKADGAVYMYQLVDDPKERATIVGFDKRFICLPIRNKAVGAILSKKP